MREASAERDAAAVDEADFKGELEVALLREAAGEGEPAPMPPLGVQKALPLTEAAPLRVAEAPLPTDDALPSAGEGVPPARCGEGELEAVPSKADALAAPDGETAPEVLPLALAVPLPSRGVAVPA